MITVACLLFAHIKLVIIAIVYLASAEILVPPKDAHAVVGTSVTFICSSSIPKSDVQWNYNPTGKSMEVVYAYGKIKPEYADRFSVQDGHNLHIPCVTMDDAGTYECQDDFGHGERRSAELTVLQENPICRLFIITRVVGSDPCSKEPNQLSLSCSVKYLGNTAPTLEWTKTGDEKTIIDGVSSAIRGNLVVYNLTLKCDSIVNGSSYNCRPAKASNTTSCNSGYIKIIDETQEACSSSCKPDSSRDYNIAITIFCLMNFLFTSFTIFLIFRFRKQPQNTGQQLASIYSQLKYIKEAE